MAITGFDYEYFISNLVTYVQENISGLEEATDEEVTTLVNGLYPTLEPGEAAAQQFYTDYGMSLGLYYSESQQDNLDTFFVKDEYILAAEAHRDAWVESKMEANPFLTEAAAIKQYDDLLNANPYQHYLDIGADLGVNPSNAFDESDFIQSVLDYFEIDMTVDDGGRELFIEALGDPLSVYIDIVAANDMTETFPALEVPEDEQVGVTPPDPTQSFELSSAATVDEGGTLTVTVTATEAVTEDTTFTYSLAGSGDAPYAAEPDDFSTATSGTVKILAGDTTGTFTVGITKGDDAEYEQAFTVTLKSGTEVIDTLTATINDTSTADNTAPVATAAVVHYNENATATTVLATVAATDPTNGDTGVTGSGVTGFEIVSGDSTTAPNFAIDATGKITFTTAGLTSTYNDADDTGTGALNTVTLGVKAVDAAGNKSETVNIQLDVDGVDDTAPEVQSAVIVGNTVTVNFGENLATTSGSPLPSDFKVNVSGSGTTGVNTVTAVLVGSASLTLTLANAAASGQTFTLDYTPSATTLMDAAGNPVVAFTGQAVKADTTAPVITSGQTTSYIEGTNDDIADIVYTVAATDADSSIASFSIESGNTSGYYAIDSKGNITLTTAGLTSAANDYETTPNSFTLGIKATDVAGNTATQNVVINVTNNTADDAAQPLELAFKLSTDAQEGASGNDTFTGDSNTIDAGDVIDGNDGTDTARLYLDGNNESFTSREVEVMEVQGTGAAARTLTATNFTGVTTINNNTSNLTGNGQLIIADVPNVVTVGFKGGDGTDDFVVNFRSGVTTGELNVNAYDAGNIRYLAVGDATGAQEFSSMKINSTGTAANTITDIKDGLSLDPISTTKLTVTGDKGLTITNTLENFTTFDLSQSSGGVSVVVDTTKDITLTGGSGGDKVNVGTTGLTTADKLDGSTGTDYLIISDADMMTSANAGNVKGFEVFQTGTSATGLETYNIDNIITNNTLAGIVVAGTTDTTVNNINTGATGNINVMAPSANVTFTAKTFVAGANNDTATINYGSSSTTTAITTGALTFTGLDTATITSNQKAGSGLTHTITSLLASDLTNVTVKGDTALKVTTALNTNPAGVDASGMTAALYWDQRNDAAGGGVLFKATNLSDTLLGNGLGATSGDTFYHGQGSDIMAVNADAGGAATMRDSFIFTATALGSGDMTAGDVETIYGFSGDNNATLEAGDDIIDMPSGMEALLKSNGTVLGSAAAPVTINTALGNSTNITTVNTTDVNLDGVNDMQIQIDINGDGKYVAGSDYAINLYGLGADTLYYDATTDVFFVGGAATATTFGAAPIVVGNTLTASAGAFNTTTGANITGGTVVTTSSDTINTTDAFLNNAANVINGLAGTNILNITDVLGGARDLRSVAEGGLLTVGMTNISNINLQAGSGANLLTAPNIAGLTIANTSAAAASVVLLGNVAQTFTGGAGADTLQVANASIAHTVNLGAGNDILSPTGVAITGTYNGETGTNTVQPSASGSNISGATLTNFTTLDLQTHVGATVTTMTLAQHNAFTVLANDNAGDQITLTTAGTVNALPDDGSAVALLYVLSNGGANTFNANTGATIYGVTGGVGVANTFNFGTTLLGSDTITGSTATDILAITGTGTASVNISNIETIQFTTSTAAQTFTTGALDINAAGTTITSAGSTVAVTIDAQGITEATAHTIIDGQGNDTILVTETVASRALEVVTLSTGGGDTIRIDDLVHLAAGATGVTVNNFTTGLGAGADSFRVILDDTAGDDLFNDYSIISAAASAATNINSATLYTCFEVNQAAAATTNLSDVADGGLVEQALATAFGVVTNTATDEALVVLYGTGAANGNAGLYSVTFTTGADATTGNMTVELIAVINGVTADSFVQSNFA